MALGLPVRSDMEPAKLLARVQAGALGNVRFADMERLIRSFGFELRRVSGSHHIFAHPEFPEIVNLQNVGGEAKPYQIRQFMRLVERYSLQLEKKS